MKKTLPFLLIFAILAWTTGCSKPVSVLLVVGGHSYDTAEFFDMFRSLEGIRFDTVSHPGAMEILQSDQVDNYDVLTFYDYIPGMPLEDTTIFLELVRKGIPMLFLHHSIASFQRWEGYQQLVGGKYVMPEYTSDTSAWSGYQHDTELNIKVLNRDHPVTRGVQDFQIRDEGYSNLTILDGVTPLLGTDHPACSPLVGWINSLENSSIIYLIFGHDKTAYQNPSFHQLLLNSLKWLTGQS